MNKRSNLDEMQEQELLKIEHNGCWLAFWGLLLAMIVQTILGRSEAVLGEWIVFMALCVYLAVDCMRKGIWDRRLKMDAKTNTIVSLVAAAAAGIFWFAFTYLRYHKPVGSLAAAVFVAVGTFVLCLLALSLAARSTRKRQAELNAEPEDEE